MGKKLNVYAGPPLAAALAHTHDDGEDGNRSGRINAVAERYLWIVSDELDRLELTRGQWCAIVDALNGAPLDGMSIAAMGQELRDADWVDEKWSVDRKALAERIDGLAVAGRIAVREAVERFWANAGMGTDAALSAAGVAPAKDGAD